MWTATIDWPLLITVMHDAAPNTQHAAVLDDMQTAPAMSASCLLNVLLGATQQSGQQLGEMQCLTAQQEPLADGVLGPSRWQNRHQAEEPTTGTML